MKKEKIAREIVCEPFIACGVKCAIMHYIYERILLPSFATSKMLRKENRPFGEKVARDMLTWRHYEFHQRLLWKAKLRGIKDPVMIVSEAKSTMKVRIIRLSDRNLGGSKLYQCRKCGLVIDRDLNAARNILMNMGICGFALIEDPIGSTLVDPIGF